MSASVLSRATGSLDLAGSFAVTAARLGTGVAARRRADRPQWLFVLYEFEACPFCRIVREALTELDLDAEIRPCPKGGERFRPALLGAAARRSFPILWTRMRASSSMSPRRSFVTSSRPMAMACPCAGAWGLCSSLVRSLREPFDRCPGARCGHQGRLGDRSSSTASRQVPMRGLCANACASSSCRTCCARSAAPMPVIGFRRVCVPACPSKRDRNRIIAAFSSIVPGGSPFLT